jgi:tetratricopeptide (TPR) repeat protein
VSVQVLQCPQCGAPAARGAKNCTHCQAPFFFERLSDLASLAPGSLQKFQAHFEKLLAGNPDDGRAALALGLCYLDLKAYREAQPQFARAKDLLPMNGEARYYEAVTLVRGRQLRSLSLPEVRRIEELLTTAIRMDEGNGLYELFLGMLKHEYYWANGLRVQPPSASELVAQGLQKGPDSGELDRLLDLVPIRDDRLYDQIAS